MTTAAELVVRVSADTASAERDLRSFSSRVLGGGGMLGTAAGTFGGVLGAQLVGGAISGIRNLSGALIGMGSDAVSAGADFEASMDGISAVLGGTSQDAERLGQFIMDLGMNPNLKVSVDEAAQAVEILATQGVTLEGIMGGVTEGTVLLANATGGDFAASANVATDAMNLFGLGVADISTIVNGATGVINQSKFDINDYAYALANGGATASQFGVDLVDFNTVIAGTSNSFVRGQTAGTAFSTMLTRLVPASGPAGDAMAELGWITEDGANIFFDATGNLKDMNEIVGILSGSLGDLTDEQRINYATQIFGTQGMDSALALSKMTREEYDALKATIANTDAFESAKVRTDNLKSAWETLGDVWQGAKISFGQALEAPLQEIVQTITPAVEVLSPVISWAGEAIGEAIQGFIDSNVKPIVALVPVTIEAYNAAGGGDAGMRAAFDTFLDGLPRTTVGDTVYQVTFAVAASWEVFDKSGSITDAVQSFIGQSLGGKVTLNLDDSISFTLPANGPGSLDFALKKTIDEQGTRSIEVGEIGFNFRTAKPMVGGVDTKSWWAAVGMDMFLPWDKGTQGVIDAGPIRLDFRAEGGQAFTIGGLPPSQFFDPKQMLAALGVAAGIVLPVPVQIAFTDASGGAGTATATSLDEFMSSTLGMGQNRSTGGFGERGAVSGFGTRAVDVVVPVKPSFEIVPSDTTLSAAIRDTMFIGPGTGAVGGGMGMTVPVTAQVTTIEPGTFNYIYPAPAAINTVEWGVFTNTYSADSAISAVDWGNFTYTYHVTAVVDYVDGMGGGPAGGGGAKAEATGTIGSQGGWTLVGERGPEMVRLPFASRVWNAAETAGMMGGGSPVIINATISDPIDIEMLARRIERLRRRH